MKGLPDGGSTCAWTSSGVTGNLGLGAPDVEQLEEPEPFRLSCEKLPKSPAEDGKFWKRGDGTCGWEYIVGGAERGTAHVLQDELRL